MINTKLLKPYIGKEVTIRARAQNYSNAFISSVEDDMLVIVTQVNFTAGTKTPVVHFIEMESITSFSVRESSLHEEHQPYIEKYNILQTFK